jgi:hypothetical protein
MECYDDKKSKRKAVREAKEREAEHYAKVGHTYGTEWRYDEGEVL